VDTELSRPCLVSTLQGIAAAATYFVEMRADRLEGDPATSAEAAFLRAMEYIQQSTALARLLDWFREQQATDLHGQADEPYSIRAHGRLSWVPVELFAPPTNEEIMPGIA